MTVYEKLVNLFIRLKPYADLAEMDADAVQDIYDEVFEEA